MRILAALSGGVDSSVAAALLVDAGHDVVGATMKLWGGKSDSGCCSVADVEDARRVADRLGIDHHVFNFTEEFERHVVGPYADAYSRGRTPNPCIECNRHLKFDAFLERAGRLSYDAIATGHHASVERDEHSGRARLLRGRDESKDQSYVLSCLTSAQLERLLLPVGELEKTEVRRIASERRLATATKPDSQDVCFVAGGSSARSRRRFLETRIELHRGTVVDGGNGDVLGEIDAVELVTVGQRRGLGVAAGERRFAVDVDVVGRRVVVGDEASLEISYVPLSERTWTGTELPEGSQVAVQASAHGRTAAAEVVGGGVRLLDARRRIAPGQTVALYVGDEVVGSGIVQPGAAAA
ncbi:MAG: tRNA 2-thiouridine(34) synthase MnmA [Acidimicrobiales bacterium]